MAQAELAMMAKGSLCAGAAFPALSTGEQEQAAVVCALLCPQHPSPSLCPEHPAAPCSLSCHCAAPRASTACSSPSRDSCQAQGMFQCSFPVPPELPLHHQCSWLQWRPSCRGCSECPQRDPSPGRVPDGDGWLAGTQSQSLTPVLATLCTPSCPAASREHHRLCLQHRLTANS